MLCSILGYFVLPQLKEQTYDEFSHENGSAKETRTIIVRKLDNSDETIMVQFSNENKFGKQELTEVTKRMKTAESGTVIPRAIIVLKFEPKFVIT